MPEERTERLYLTRGEMEKIAEHLFPSAVSQHLLHGQHEPANGICYAVKLTRNEHADVTAAWDELELGM
jgi:hypothetical protein